jgi:hypothetical protein
MEAGEGGLLTFVIWLIGLAILIGMAMGNAAIVAVAFRRHWVLGLLTLGASLLVWRVLLAQFS